jgi:hypothetical protein
MSAKALIKDLANWRLAKEEMEKAIESIVESDGEVDHDPELAKALYAAIDEFDMSVFCGNLPAECMEFIQDLVHEEQLEILRKRRLR